MTIVGVMDNTRYVGFVRFAGVAGLVSALILVVNAAKRASLLPTVPATQLAAPLAEVAAIFFVFGLLLWSTTRSRFAVAATILNASALALLVGVEFLINLVFADVDRAVTASLLSGSAGIAITVTSVLFLVATVLWGVALWTTIPTVSLATYCVGAIVVSLRAFVPELVLDIALVVMALGIIGLAAPMVAGRQSAAYVARTL